MNPGKLIIEHSSPFSFNKTVELLTTKAEQKQWKVPAVHDLQQSLEKSGKIVKPVKVIEICKPEYSGQILELNDERIISVMMPCRISVYEKDDGKTYVALINSAALSKDMPEIIAKTMKDASNETFEIVNDVIGRI